VPLFPLLSRRGSEAVDGVFGVITSCLPINFDWLVPSIALEGYSLICYAGTGEAERNGRNGSRNKRTMRGLPSLLLLPLHAR